LTSYYKEEKAQVVQCVLVPRTYGQLRPFWRSCEGVGGGGGGRGGGGGGCGGWVGSGGKRPEKKFLVNHDGFSQKKKKTHNKNLTTFEPITRKSKEGNTSGEVGKQSGFLTTSRRCTGEKNSGETRLSVYPTQGGARRAPRKNPTGRQTREEQGDREGGDGGGKG